MIPRTRPPLLLVLLAALCCCFLAAAPDHDADVKVTVYEGPTECDNKPASGREGEEDESLERIVPDSIAGLHFTVYVDESTVGSRETAGVKIESSHDMGVAPSFPVGQGRVIAGLDRGLVGLCRHSKATIVVPPHLAYGPYGKPEQGVGPHATLRYDVEILDIKPPVPNEFKKIDADGDWRISRREAKTYFDRIGQGVDLDSLWSEEDDDGDGYISWEEFKGAKGSEEPPSVRQRELEKKRKEEMEKARKKRERNTDWRERHAQEAEARRILEMYSKMDADGDGKLSRNELGAMFEEFGQQMSDAFWDESDTDGDGYVASDEFAWAEARKVLEMYSKMDEDGDGKLSRGELGAMFKEFGQEMPDSFWDESDPDGDGYVTFEEFVGDAGKKEKKKGGKMDEKDEEEGNLGGHDLIDMDEL